MLGVLGVIASLTLTVVVALMSSRGVASADVPRQPAQADPARQNRLTLVREIGGTARSSPTPGTGVTASAPAAPGSISTTESPAGLTASQGTAGQSAAATALRQLRRVGRALVTVDGVRRLALGGAVPFTDGSTVTALLLSDEADEVALADATSANDPEVTLGEGTTFMRFTAANQEASVQGQPGRIDAVVLASPAAVTATPLTIKPIPTAIPTTVLTSPATATSVPATTVAATATPAVVTATPVPATQTPVIITATPEATRRATRTPTPEVVIVTATPAPQSMFPNALQPLLPQVVPPGMLPWLMNPPTTATPVPTSLPAATNTPVPPPTAAPTSTPVPTATSVVPDARTASAPPPPPIRRDPTAPPASSDGQAPILGETGTRTPATATPRAAQQRQATPTAPQTGQPATANVPAPSPQRDPAILEKLATRALTAVNAARAQAGALPLARSAALDNASALHAQYDVATGQVEGNFQTRGTPFFVGETPAARAARAAGSRAPGADRVAEVMALGEVEPERAVQGWLDSVFHRVLLLDLSAQYAGYGQHTAGSSTTSVLDLGGRRDVANASGWFPANGATEVPTRCLCDDFAETAGRQGPFGYPTTLLLGQVRPQGMPTVARMTEGAEDGPSVATELVDAYGNPTLLPQAPLKPNTRYTVHLSWTNGPSVSWSFTTGAQ
jgi:uncharacterized protein YkwD